MTKRVYVVRINPQQSQAHLLHRGFATLFHGVSLVQILMRRPIFWELNFFLLFFSKCSLDKTQHGPCISLPEIILATIPKGYDNSWQGTPCDEVAKLLSYMATGKTFCWHNVTACFIRTYGDKDFGAFIVDILLNIHRIQCFASQGSPFAAG